MRTLSYKLTLGIVLLPLSIHAQYNLVVNGPISLTPGNQNVFIGLNVGNSTMSGINNVFLGQRIGTFNINGSLNTFLGIDAGYSNTYGTHNVFVGNAAGAGSVR